MSSRILISLQNLLRREPLKLVDGGVSQRTFIYIKDAIEAVLLMIENPSRANGHIFNVGNPNNEVSVRQLAEIMTQVCRHEVFFLKKKYIWCFLTLFGNNLSKLISIFPFQVYSNVSSEPPLEVPTIDVSSKVFYGEGYDDSDRRIPDMTIINKQLGKFNQCPLFHLDLYTMP